METAIGMTEIAEQDDARSERNQERIFAIAKELSGLCADTDSLTPAACIELVRIAARTLTAVGDGPDSVSEFITPDEFVLPAHVVGQILMTFSGIELTADKKRFFIGVTEHMGPDWLEFLRRDVAFMVKVESF